MGNVRKRALSPKTERLFNKRLDMIDTGIADQPGYLRDHHDKISFCERMLANFES